MDCLTQRWYNENDPAIGFCEYSPEIVGKNDYQEWWAHGKCHREDGPASEQLTEQEFNKSSTKPL